jgi:hypothetical protein
MRWRSAAATHAFFDGEALSGFGCGGLKLTGTWMVVGTGWPLRVAALNFHSRTRWMAASSSWLLPLLVSSVTSVGVPCADHDLEHALAADAAAGQFDRVVRRRRLYRGHLGRGDRRRGRFGRPQALSAVAVAREPSSRCAFMSLLREVRMPWRHR